MAANYFHSATAPSLENQARTPYGRSGSRTVVRDTIGAVQQVQAGLVEMGVPPGLAETLAQDDQRIGKRIYLLDNSGSMNAPDGNLLEEGGGGRLIPKQCTRWEEITAFAKEHARWNLAVGTPCEFMLLNSPSQGTGLAGQEGRDFVSIDRFGGDDAVQLASLDRLLSNGPRGVTPIAERLEEIRLRLHAEAAELAQREQMVFLTLATDGLPTSPLSGQSTSADQEQMVKALRRLCAELPVQLVIRLCTDDAQTVEFYNKIDDEYELPLDILDDYVSEAQEIMSNGNGWFTYTPVLHRIREAGTLCKLLDAIDEAELRPIEVRQMVSMLGQASMEATMRTKNDREFVNEVAKMASSAKPVFDPITQQMQPFVNLKRLRRALKVGFRGNVLPVFFPCASA